MYISRNIDGDLENWKNSENRKPLLLRGVRQCGKTSSIRMLATSFKYFVEVNFEKTPVAKKIFMRDMDITRICSELEELVGIPIVDGETLIEFAKFS